MLSGKEILDDSPESCLKDIPSQKCLENEPYQSKPLEHDESDTQPAPSKDEATFWRNMFETLRKERVTNAEKQLHATLQENIRRDEALRTMVQHLENEKQTYKKRAETAEKLLETMQHCKENVSSSTNKNTEADCTSESRKRKRLEKKLEMKEQQITSLQKQIEQHDHVLELYEILTSTKVSKTSSQKDANHYASYDCTVINHEEKKATQFRLSYLASCDQQKSETPLSTIREIRCEPLANAEFLPHFMQDPEPIIFERTQCAVLFKNVLMQMFNEEENVEEEERGKSPK
jgi:hypothetical protein